MNGQKKKNPNQTMILRIIIEKKNEGTARKSEGRYKRAVKIQSRPNTVMRIKENSRTDGDEVRKGRMKKREREREREKRVPSIRLATMGFSFSGSDSIRRVIDSVRLRYLQSVESSSCRCPGTSSHHARQ